MASTQEQREMRDEVLELLDEGNLDIRSFEEKFLIVARRRRISFAEGPTKARCISLSQSVKSLVMTALNRRKLAQQKALCSRRKPEKESPRRIIFDGRMAAAGEKREDYC